MNTQQFYEWIGKPRSLATLLKPIVTSESGNECLASFLLRNQLGLGTSASQLMEYAALILASNEQALVKSHLFSTSALPLNLNGNSDRTLALCEALLHLQPGTDFKAMTLEAYEYQANGLLLQPKLKKELHWCSSCFDDWLVGGIDIHYPLAWLLQGNHSCKKHSKPFSNVCPHCGMRHKSLNRYLMKGECSRCKGSLTKPSHLRVVGQAELF